MIARTSLIYDSRRGRKGGSRLKLAGALSRRSKPAPGARRRATDTMRPRKGRCCRIGRGQAVADRLKLMAGGRGARMRRVIVEATIVRLTVGSGGAEAHARYPQRHGITVTGRRVLSS